MYFILIINMIQYARGVDMKKFITYNLNYFNEEQYTNVVCITKYKGTYLVLYNKKRNAGNFLI